jgi:hypothetical protein
MLARNGLQTYATMRKIEGEGSNQTTDIAKNENLPKLFNLILMTISQS